MIRNVPRCSSGLLVLRSETTARIRFKSLGIPGRWLVRSREGDQSGRTVSLFRKIAAAMQA